MHAALLFILSHYNLRGRLYIHCYRGAENKRLLNPNVCRDGRLVPISLSDSVGKIDAVCDLQRVYCGWPLSEGIYALGGGRGTGRRPG